MPFPPAFALAPTTAPSLSPLRASLRISSFLPTRPPPHLHRHRRPHLRPTPTRAAAHRPPPPPPPTPDTPSLNLLPPPPAGPPPPPPPDPSAQQTSALRLALLASLSSFALGTALGRFSVSPTFPPVLDMPSAASSSLSAFIAGPHFVVALGMGLSAFIQALTGFGFAIVSVGALSQLPWIAHSSVFNAVQPVTATLGALTGWALILPDLRRVNWPTVTTLLIATSLATPFGAVALDYLDASLVIRALGALISGYVLYSVLGVPVPKRLGGSAGAWGLGFLAGALGGAFDITGPPLVVHGEAAGWDTPSGDFRRNVLAVVTVNSTLVVLWDLFAGRLNDYYYFDFVRWAAPTTIIGIIAGKFFADRMDPSAFKKVVLGTCLVMGIKLIFT